MTYHFQLHRENGGYWAECCELAGCVTQGDTLDDLHGACREALTLYLDEPSGAFPPPNAALDADHSLLKIAVEPELASAT
ncbi:MAG: type II toxin-antitoxin system HicB family antitoxin [Planctomycetota bacterium]|jgi:predicted RNase H-like HicB family nuclease|nr:type II toxin-antitoxin system HicB family antitoxin [Planctomycetota bacterium]